VVTDRLLKCIRCMHGSRLGSRTPCPPPPPTLKRKHPQGNKVQDDEDEKEYDDLDFQPHSMQDVCQVQLGLAMQVMDATQIMHASSGIDR
jgi:hypothetical protein